MDIYIAEYLCAFLEVEKEGLKLTGDIKVFWILDGAEVSLIQKQLVISAVNTKCGSGDKSKEVERLLDEMVVALL